MASIQQPLLLIGGGNMGRAIVEGAVRAGVLAASRVVVFDPDPAKHPPLTALGTFCTTAVADALTSLNALESTHAPAAILLAVKPQMLNTVEADLADAAKHPTRLVMSILAGTPTPRLAETIGGRVVRLMPNTPAQIGKGITALCPGPGATPQDLATARHLFEAVGKVIDLPESLLDAFTAVAGSGPAYFFHLAESMAAGAEAVGFDRAQALELVRATLAGAAGLLESATDTDPADLRAMVTSKGGTTAAALAELEKRGVLAATTDAILAARDRGRELAIQ